MKRIVTITLCLFMAIALQAQTTKYEIKYSYKYNTQEYDYIEKLGYAEGLIVREGDSLIVVNNVKYDVTSKDVDEKDDKVRSLQYTVTDEAKNEFIICFKEEYTYPEELVYQVIIFNTSNPYEWLYYITNTPKEIK